MSRERFVLTIRRKDLAPKEEAFGKKHKRAQKSAGVVMTMATTVAEVEPKWPAWSALPDEDVCAICLSVPNRRGRIESCSHLFCFQCVFDWSRVETKCPMCKRRFYWIEKEGERKGDDENDDDGASNTAPTKESNKNNNQREKPLYCPLKNQNGNQEDEDQDDDVDPAEHIVCTVCQSGDDERNLLLCDGCDEGYHVSCVGLQRVPRGRWHCPSCASWEREREEREANRRRLSGVSTTTTTRTRRDGSTSRAARMARAPGSNASPNTRLGMLEALVNPTSNDDMHDEIALRENVLLASAANEDPTHREIRLVRERRHANRMRNGEVRLTGGGGGLIAFNRGDSHRRRQIAIVQELRNAWERLIKEEEEFPDVDEVELMMQSRRGSRNTNTTSDDLENARSNANIDVETAWKLIDSARAEEEKEKKVKGRKNRKVALGRSAQENEQPLSLQPQNVSADSVKRPKIRLRESTDNKNALGMPQSVAVAKREELPSFLRNTLGGGGDGVGGSNYASNAKEKDDHDRKNEEEQIPLPPSPPIDVSSTAADAAKALLIQPFRDKTLTKDQYKSTIKSIVKKCVEAEKNMRRLRAGSITVADIERIARIDAEEIVVAAARKM